ncbi:MAG: hypothetical protein LiPW30_203 [Parcubacteria group bacterium LiPW_30]|nr:MAG: hypothetical protein LiPW30_203 [Parcubacteria group bacterium LiPW_30]
MDYTNQQLEQMLESLPEDVKGVLFGFDTGSKIRNIGAKYSLHIDKLSILVDETNLVMFGLTKPNDFSEIIQSKLNVTKDVAELIVHDINEQIFDSIRESLKKIHNTDEMVEIKHSNISENSLPQESGVQITLEPIDKTILRESGIEIVDNEQLATEAGENLNRETVLKDIETPTKAEERSLPPKKEVLQINQPDIKVELESGKEGSEKIIQETPVVKNIVAEKLTNDFAIPKKESTYQLDPYREQV